MAKDWVVEGKPHYVAFQPRENLDINGVSLFFDKQEAGKRFTRPIFGFLDVNVEAVRRINAQTGTGHLDVIQDEE
ncbi:MAG TPA: hypothetical protein VF571_16930, partial [Pyrinomonadaceae bacterium]